MNFNVFSNVGNTTVARKVVYDKKTHTCHVRSRNFTSDCFEKEEICRTSCISEGFDRYECRGKTHKCYCFKSTVNQPSDLKFVV